MAWFEATGVWGWVILLVALPPLLASIASAFIRVERSKAILLVACSSLPMLVGVVGMVDCRRQTDKVLLTLTPPMPELRAEGYEEAQHCVWLGLGAMLVCDAAAVAAFLRSKIPGA